MGKVIIKEVESRKELKKFCDVPNKMYRDVEAFVPAFYADDIDDWDAKKNPAMEYCERKCFLAYRDGEIVGRIAAILSHKSNEKWNTKRMRFSQVDFIDDIEVSRALFAAVEEWAKQKGCDQVHGPLGFSDMDREGMLVEGYDKRNMFITYYNYPYYNTHLEQLGYAKDTDWIEYKITAPGADNPTAQKLHRIAKRVLARGGYHIAKVKTRFGYGPYIKKAFKLLNSAYAPLYGTVEFNDRQIQKYSDKFIPLLDPRFCVFVLDKDDEVVALGISAPSIADGIKKGNGRFLPFGWIHILNNLLHPKALDMFLIAVRPDLQGSGLNAVVLDHLIGNAIKCGIEYAETGPQLETNSKILAQWKTFEKVQHKRRRCYIKNI